MPETKLRLLQNFSSLSAESPNTYMGFAIPGGMISGKPATDYADWVQSTMGRILGPDLKPQPDEAHKRNRYIVLKDATLRQDGYQIIVGAVDALEVSAWGYRTPPTK